MENNELVVVEKNNIPKIFEEGGCDPLLKRIKEEVGKFKGDITTTTGRKEIASMAHKVARSKTYLDGLGKDLVAEIKARANVIDSERKKVRDQLDALKEEVRKPLTEWEEAEEKRIEDIKVRIEDMSYQLNIEFEDLDAMKQSLQKVKATSIDETFAEFAVEAAKVKDMVITQLEAKIIIVEKELREAEEAERIEQEKLDKERKDREEKIAKEAAEKARKEAEEKALREAEEKEKAAKEEHERLEREALEAKLAAERAEREKREAAENAEKEKQIAIEVDRKKREEERQRIKKAEEKKAANRRHREKIEKEAESCFMEIGFDKQTSVNVVQLISEGRIKNISINY